jgi:hypothetical protein
MKHIGRIGNVTYFDLYYIYIYVCMYVCMYVCIQHTFLLVLSVSISWKCKMKWKIVEKLEVGKLMYAFCGILKTFGKPNMGLDFKY